MNITYVAMRLINCQHDQPIWIEKCALKQSNMQFETILFECFCILLNSLLKLMEYVIITSIRRQSYSHYDKVDKVDNGV